MIDLWTRFDVLVGYLRPGWAAASQSPLQLVGLGLLATSLLGLLVFGIYLLWPEWACSFRAVPGPRPAHWLYGDTRQLMSLPNGTLQTAWTKEYGPTVRYLTTLRRPVLLTIDPVAVHYIHTHPDLFLQPTATRQFSINTMGPSLTAVEGADHRRQRRAIAPSFAPAQIRTMIPMMLRKAGQLADVVIEASTHGNGAEKGRVDFTRYIHQLTLDVIALGAFDTDVNALGGADGANELIQAWRRMTAAQFGTGLISLLQRAGLPFMRIFRNDRMDAVNDASAMMRDVGRRLIEQKRSQIALEAGQRFKKDDLSGHDLMTNILRANMASDLGEKQRMSDAEVAAQMPLFLFAGNMTVAVSLAWAVGVLAKNPEMQERLRAELSELDDDPAWETLNSIPYLEAFVHELLRCYPAAPTLFRVPDRDVILPLATPITTRGGTVMHNLPLKKGDTVHIAYGQMNFSTETFGPDAAEFKPDRFLKRETNEGSWDGTHTFGGGPRNCIGSRFAIAEIKVTLFVLMRRMSVSETANKPEFARFGGLGLTRPKVGGKVEMPLVVKPL